MAKLLIVEDSIIVQALFKELLDVGNTFEYDIAKSFEEAKSLLKCKRYEYAVVERILKDAPNGEVIALLNSHNIAPLVFTNHIDEDFFDEFEGAKIVSYIKKIRFNNEVNVIKQLKQLQANKQTKILVASDSKIYSTYLRENLKLHNFKVVNAHNDEEVHERLALHPDISLLVLDSNEPYLNSLEIVKKIRKTAQNNELKILTLVDSSNSFVTSTQLHNGSDDYLIKDFSRDEFYVRVYQNINKLC